jgi:hypothetical protein
MSSTTEHDYEKPSHHPYTSEQTIQPIEPDDSIFDYNGKSEDIDIENVDLEKSSAGSPHPSAAIEGEPPSGSFKAISNIGVPVSKTTTRVSVNNTSQIPNGGTLAWVQVLGSFFLFFNTWYVYFPPERKVTPPGRATLVTLCDLSRWSWLTNLTTRGIMNTFGVYQTIYETSYLKSSTPSAISWIGSIQIFLLMVVGALTGPIYDAGHFRLLVMVGSFLIVFGHMMLSLCTSYWQVVLAQAICVGMGTGCLFVPAVAIISTYFHSKLALATGIAASGSSLGWSLPVCSRSLS